MEKIALATISTDIGRMTIYYNGSGENITAEIDDVVEEIAYIPDDVEDAENAVWMMYGVNPIGVWDFEWIER